MRKKVVFLMLCVLFVLTACGQSGSKQTAGNTGSPNVSSPSAKPSDKPAEKLDFPKKDITFIVPYNPGGGYDAWGRSFALYAKKYLPADVNMVVSNKPGGAGRSGTTAIYKARTDSYTIGFAESLMAAPQVAIGVDEMGFDLRKFTWLGQLAAEPYVIAIGNKSSAKSMKDLKGKQVRWGVVATNASDLIAAQIYGLDVTWVQGFQGAAEQVAAMTRGDIDLIGLGASSLTKFIQSGDVKPLVALSPKRSPLLPNAPTIGEEMGEQMDFSVFRIIAGPPDIDKNHAKYLEDLIQKVLLDDEFKKWAAGNQFLLDPARGADVGKSMDSLLNSLEKYKSSFVEVIKKQMTGK